MLNVKHPFSSPEHGLYQVDGETLNLGFKHTTNIDSALLFSVQNIVIFIFQESITAKTV